MFLLLFSYAENLGLQNPPKPYKSTGLLMLPT